VSWEVNLVANSDALVDSAEDGKKPALSFCWTLDSFPKSGPATPLIANQAMITAIAPQRIFLPLGEDLVERWVVFSDMLVKPLQLGESRS
jgi:hypothetical protein